MRETVQNVELKQAKIALFSLPYGTYRELCVRVRHCINWCKSHTKKVTKLCLCIQPATFFNHSVVKNGDGSNLLDTVL